MRACVCVYVQVACAWFQVACGMCHMRIMRLVACVCVCAMCAVCVRVRMFRVRKTWRVACVIFVHVRMWHDVAFGHVKDYYW
jgi:hypothetical protein